MKHFSIRSIVWSSIPTLLVLNTAQVCAQLPELLSIDFGGIVHRWNVETDEQSGGGAWGTAGFGAMTRLLDGRYVLSRSDFAGGMPGLVLVDPDDFTMSFLGQYQPGITSLISMTVTPCNNILATHSGFDRNFYLVDPRTMNHQVVPITLSNGASSYSTGSLATASDGEIYSWMSGFETSQGVFSKLFRIDLDSGIAVEIGGFEFIQSSDNLTLAFAPDGRLFGFTDINGGSNNGPLTPNGIYEVNLSTGVPTFIRAGDPDILGGIRGAEFVVDEPQIVLPESMAIITGSVNTGGLQEVCVSDDQYLELDPLFSVNRYQLRFTFDATLPTETPSELQFSFEANTSNLVGTVVQRIELYNYNTGQFETLDTRNATASDSVTTVSPSGDLSRFVEAGTGAVSAQIRYENAFAYWVFFVINLYLPFQTNVDQVFWDLSISD